MSALPAPSRSLATTVPPEPATLANATLLGVGPIRDLERVIAHPSQPLAKGSTPRIPEAEDHWQSFEDLGPAPSSRPAADRKRKLAGAASRRLGPSVLALGAAVLAVVLAGYITSTVFYYLSSSWIAPVRVSPTDDRVARSPYLRALAGGAVIAFVPYGNGAATPGAPVYACRAAMVVCRQVGTVAGALPGEVTSRHPRRDRVMRGRMVELALSADETDAAERDVLFVGGKPLGF